MSSSQRIVGLDIARGLAVVSMLLWHTADGWLAEPMRDSVAFSALNFIGVLALPAFLFLAGFSVELVHRRGRSAWKHGVRVIVAGYALQLVLMLVDGGFTFDGLMRVDILHAIGLSILALEAMRYFFAAHWFSVLAMGLLMGLGWLINPLGAQMSGPIRYVVALFIDVPPLTLFPAIPLVFLAAFGYLAAKLPRRALWWSVLPGIVCYFLFDLVASQATVDRSHPAIVLNLIDLGGRAAGLTAFGFLLDKAFRHEWRALVLLGRHSLMIYALHLSFAFGRLSPWNRNLNSATLYGVGAALMIASAILLAYLRDFMRQRRRSKGSHLALP